MDKTPERIEFPNGCYWQDGFICDAKGKHLTDVIGHGEAEYPHKTLHEAGLVAKAKEAYPILARHRQPAAVSADAMELARYFATSWLSLSEKDIAGRIQAYGDACRLDGARKMQEAAGNAAHECGYYSQAYVDDEPPMEVVHHNTGVWKARDVIRALSPETVCEGK